MALARANCLKALLLQRVSFYPSGSAANLGERPAAAAYSFPYFSTSSGATGTPEDQSTLVAVIQPGRGGAPTSSRSTNSRCRGRRGLSSMNPRDLTGPFHHNNWVGNALMQVSESLNRLLEGWWPSRLLGRLKEDDRGYKLRYEMPGLKEDLLITVEEGMLVITVEAEEEEGEETSTTEDEERVSGWYARRYGYYNATVLLPEDAKVEEITAELKDAILLIYIPKTEEEQRQRNSDQVELQWRSLCSVFSAKLLVTFSLKN